MPTPDNTYRLVIFEAPDEPQAVRDLICGVTGIHPTDAMQWIARAPGIWPKPLAEGEARELLDGLYDLRVPAEAHRADLLPELSPPRNVHAAACLSEGFRVQGLRGEAAHWVPWDRVELISAGRIDAGDEYRDVAPPGWVSAISTGLNAMVGRAPRAARRSRAMRIPRDPACEVIIVRRDPRLAFRVVADKMNYAYLGDRLRPSSAENFPVFVAELCVRAAHATITPPTRSLLEDPTSDACRFASPQALLDYTTHRLLWSWYRRDRDAQAATDPDVETSSDF